MSRPVSPAVPFSSVHPPSSVSSSATSPPLPPLSYDIHPLSYGLSLVVKSITSSRPPVSPLATILTSGRPPIRGGYPISDDSLDEAASVLRRSFSVEALSVALHLPNADGGAFIREWAYREVSGALMDYNARSMIALVHNNDRLAVAGLCINYDFFTYRSFIGAWYERSKSIESPAAVLDCVPLGAGSETETIAEWYTVPRINSILSSVLYHAILECTGAMGVIGGYPGPIPYGEIFFIDLLAVEPSWTGRGIGASLVKSSEKLAAQSNYKYILVLASSQYSQPLFAKLGYTIIRSFPYQQIKYFHVSPCRLAKPYPDRMDAMYIKVADAIKLRNANNNNNNNNNSKGKKQEDLLYD